MPDLLIAIKKIELVEYIFSFLNNHSGVWGYYGFYVIVFIILITFSFLVAW